MSEDDLLWQLGHLARERAGDGPCSLDERWDRLAAGTLRPEEEAELRRLAETSEDARLAYEAFRPLGPEFAAKVAQELAAQIAVSRESQLAPVSLVVAAREAGAGGTGGRVLPFRGTMRRLAAWGTGVGASAAAMVVVLLGMAPPLPVYQMAELSGGSRTTRGDLTEEPRFAPGDRCQVVLSPATSVRWASSLDAEAFMVRGADVRQLAVESEIDEGGGGVRLTSTIDRHLPPGSWTLWLVVGRKWTLPDAADVRAFSGAATRRERNWVAVPKTLQIQPRAPD